MSQIPNFDDEDKKKIFIISMGKIIKSKGFLIIILLLVILSIFALFWIYILYLTIAIFSLVIFILICKSLCQKEEYCFLIIFILNIIYIIFVGIFWWWLNQCSIEYFIDKIWCWLLPIIELVFFIIYIIYKSNEYKKDNGAHTFQQNQIICFPFAIINYLNSNLNIDNLLENEIINKNENN